MPPAKTKYVRNLRYVPVAVRLGNGRSIDLKPLGQRGDCRPVTKDDMEDEIFLGNVGLLFEVIPNAEAKKVIDKQSTNEHSVATHPALANLRNERGEEYQSEPKLSENFEDQGKVVAEVTDRGMITRFKAPGTTDQPLPEIPDHVPPEEAADWVARQRQTEGPEAGLAGLNVVKEDVQTNDNS